MKAILLILVLLTFSQAAYVLVPPAEYNELPILQKTLAFGLKFTLGFLIDEGKLINVTYHITHNNSIWNQTNGHIVDYKFNLTLTNIQQDIVQANFIVAYNTSSKTSRVVSSNATNITYGIATDATYRPVPKKDWNTTIVNDSITFGVNYVALRLVGLGKIPSGSYKASKIYNVWKQIDETVVDNYKVSLQAQSTGNATFIFNSTFFVRFNPHTDSRSVYAWSYHLPVLV